MNQSSTEVHAPNYKIMSIKLSKEGKEAIASAFPPKAIAYADEHFDMVNGNLSPWLKFKELCIAYCREHNLPINFKILKGTSASSMIESQVHRQSFKSGSSVSSPLGSRRKTFQKEEEVSHKTNHASPVHHDKPRISPHFIDLRFWGPKR